MWDGTQTFFAYKFTGKERDAESGLDYFGARYYSSSHGRFEAVDPSRLSIDASDPQSWNRYVYARNDPLGFVDRNGLWPTWVHNDILDAAFGGVLSRHQIGVLKQASKDVDSGAGQKPENSNQHSMCAPGQSQHACGEGIMEFINLNLAMAQGTQRGDPVLQDTSLYYLGKAIHTLTDMASPMHTLDNGNPITWNGRTGEGVAHLWGERLASVNWYRFGQAIRNAVAAFSVTLHDFSQKGGDPQKRAQAAIEAAVSRHFALPDQSGYLARAHEAARQCALGNRAACGAE